jgi:PadR family transcriptional regulator, regulatory protein PadR
LTFLAYLFYIAKQMKRGELLGSLEHIILLALARLDGNAHGMIVRREIEERTGRNISIGAVYATLERLEAKGYVSSSTGDPTPERGGRAKRLFRVEGSEFQIREDAPVYKLRALDLVVGAIMVDTSAGQRALIGPADFMLKLKIDCRLPARQSAGSRLRSG